MSAAEGVLIEIRVEAGGSGGILSCPRNIQPGPGQYLLAASTDRNETLPVVLFPASLPAVEISLAPPLPASWLPGSRLSLRGPLGRGFDLPRGVEKVALAAFHAPPALLFPLARLALDRGAAVAFYSAEPPAGLPMEVEVLPLDMLTDALAWADFLAAALAPANLAPFRRACGLAVHRHFRPVAQALLLTPMPCAGTGECGLCAVTTTRNYQLACNDGPVFDLNHLELV
jgi:NAD(P)H-flavin reductase